MKYNFGIAMLQYKQKFEEIFSRDGLTRKIAEKFFPLMVLRPGEARQLFLHAKEIPDGGVYLEIGSWWGGSLICVHEATKLMGKTINLIAIEPRVKQELLRNTKSIPNLRLIKMESDYAADEIKDDSVDLAFLDGDHNYKQVARDILNYWSKIKMDGMLLGHDYTEKDKRFGVKKAADEMFKMELVKPEGSNRIFQVKKIQGQRKLQIPIERFLEKETKLKCDIIMPTYNRKIFLRRAIRSVLNQTSPSWELWICDDGSDFDSKKIVDEFRDKRIHFIQGPKLTAKERLDHSSSIPRNTLLTASSNEIIIYLDDDNYLWPRAVKGALRYFAQHPDRDIVYGKLTYSDKQIEKSRVPKERREFRAFKQGRLDTGQVIHRRKCLDWTFKRWNAYWPPGAKVCGDFHFHHQLRLKYKFYPLDIFFANKYVHRYMHLKLAYRKKRGEKRRE